MMAKLIRFVAALQLLARASGESIDVVVAGECNVFSKILTVPLVKFLEDPASKSRDTSRRNDHFAQASVDSGTKCLAYHYLQMTSAFYCWVAH